MTDGRVYTLEDEIDVLHEDLGRARKRLDLLERAPFESRVADPDEHERSLGGFGETRYCASRRACIIRFHSGVADV